MNSVRKKNYFSNELVEQYKKKGFIKSETPLFDLNTVKKFNQLLEPLIDLSKKNEKDLHIIGLLHKAPDFLDYIINDTILDRVESLIGKNIALSSSNAFIKLAGTKSKYNWHTDFYNSPHFEEIAKIDVTAMSIALTPSTIESGCLQFVVGSHLNKGPHKYQIPENGILEKSYIAYGLDINTIDTSQGIETVELQPGFASFHNIHTVHGSEQNNSTMDRLHINFWFFNSDVSHLKSEAIDFLKSENNFRIQLRGRDTHKLCKFSLN